MKGFWDVKPGGNLERALQAKQVVEEPGVWAIVGVLIGGKLWLIGGCEGLDEVLGPRLCCHRNLVRVCGRGVVMVEDEEVEG